MEWLGGNTHSSLFPHKPNLSFPPKLGGIEGNGMEFNKILTEMLKIPLIFYKFSRTKVQW
jgi:hypothetical protein